MTCPDCGAFDPMGDEAAWHKEGCTVNQTPTAQIPTGPVQGHGGPWPRGRWTGKGTDGRQAVYAKHSHGYRGYWWYVGLNGDHRGVQYCDHAHKTPETAWACGEREARRLNRVLDRVRGPVPDA